jgi:hypothetical protein
MNKKYTFTMVVVKPTGKGGKPLNPKPIKPKPLNKSEGGMSNKPKKPKIIQLMPQGVFYKGKAKDYPGIKELIKNKNKKSQGGEMLKDGQRKLDKREIGRRGRDPYVVQPRKPSPQPLDKPKPGIGSLQKADIEKNNKIKQVKAKFAALKETARDELTPMKSDRVFSKFRRPDSAKEFYADEPGSKYEGMAKEAMKEKINYFKNMKQGGLTGGQRKLDKNKDGKISGDDFKLIRREKPEMKPLKAREGKMVKTPDGKKEEDKYSKYVRSIKLPDAKDIRNEVKKKAMGGEIKKGYGAARQSGMGLQDENLQPGKSMDYYKDLI